MTFETFDQSDEETWPDQKRQRKRQRQRQRTMTDLWHLRHWLQLRQLRTWIHDNLCYLTIKSDTGQHSQFLRCLHKGRGPKKNVFLMVFCQTPPLPPIRATWSSFFRTSNDVLRVWQKTSQELRMLSSVTINWQETKIVINPGSQLSVNCNQCLKCHKSLWLLL